MVSRIVTNAYLTLADYFIAPPDFIFNTLLRSQTYDRRARPSHPLTDANGSHASTNVGLIRILKFMRPDEILIWDKLQRKRNA